MNNVSLIGRLTKDPELRYTQSGQAVARFTLAVDRGYSKEKKLEAESKNQQTADFIGITAWGKTAELVANYMTKGRQMGLEGRIQTGSYEKDGRRVYTTDVVADRVHFLGSAQQNDNDYSQSMGQFQNQPVNQAYGNQGQGQRQNQNQNANQNQYNQDDDLDGYYPVDSDDIPF